jgi:hypothetical protein
MMAIEDGVEVFYNVLEAEVRSEPRHAVGFV